LRANVPRDDEEGRSSFRLIDEDLDDDEEGLSSFRPVDEDLDNGKWC